MSDTTTPVSRAATAAAAIGRTDARPSTATVFTSPDAPDVQGEAENDYIEEDFEHPTRSARPVRWASDDDSSCYSHLLGEGQKSVVVDKTFEITRREIDLIIEANSYKPQGHGNTICFGIRGARLRGAEKYENVDRLPLEDARPDHVNFRCVIGYYHRDTGKLTAYTGSTVPWHEYMSRGVRHNLLPPGCYIYQLGTHRPATQSRWVTPALRLSDQAGSPSGEVTVLRNTDDLIFDYEDEWDRCKPSDNIHCAYSNRSFSSLGCQTIKGGMNDGLWADYQKHLRTLPAKARVDYVMFTGAEASIAASLLKGGAAPDKEAVTRRLGRLRFGSESERVSRLQARLGGTPTGYFGAATKSTLIALQESNDVRSDGIYTPALDAKLGWGIFSDAPPAVAAPKPVEAPAAAPAVAVSPPPAPAPTPVAQPAPAPAPQPVAAAEPPPAAVPIPAPAPVAEAPAAPAPVPAAAPAVAAPPAPTPVQVAAAEPAATIKSASASPERPTVGSIMGTNPSSATMAAISALAAAKAASQVGSPAAAAPAGAAASADAAPAAPPASAPATAPASPAPPPQVTAQPTPAAPAPASPAAAPAPAAAAAETTPVATPTPAPAAASPPAAVQAPAPSPAPIATPAPAAAPSPKPTPAPAAAPAGPPPAVLLTVDSLTAFAPKARQDYLKVLAEQGNAVLTQFGINRNERRFCHFMAQVGHECGGFTIVEESGAYSAAGIMRIFGVGRHSAGVTESEAKRIAAIQPVSKRADVLFERVYGPERSPRKARDLGNTQPGDGSKYRGRGFLQITGRSAYREMGRRIGLDLENNPSLAGEPIGALMTAAAFWESRKLNTHADQNNIERITKLINGGQNGLADRRAKLAKALEIWGEDDSRGGLRRSGPEAAGDGTLAYGDLGPEVVEVKRMLSALGYEGFVMDEDFSKATHLAVASYQIDRGMPGNGIVDAETRRSLMQDAASAGYSPESVKRGGPPVPNPVPKQHPETEPTSFNWGRGRAVWVWSMVFLLAAGAYLGLRVLDNPNLFRSQSPADWATIGFAGIVGLGSIILWALGHRIARSSKRRAVVRHGERGLPPDEGLRRDPDSTS